jgi:hypothetical protein
MRNKASLIIAVFILFCASTADVQKASAQSSGNSKGVVERASAAGAQSTAGLGHETHLPATSVPFEPLLLLLLGSTLFSIGTAINKLILSRELSPKTIPTVTRSK